MKYRAEIDGLRALAVMPVIFFHAGLASFSGGFVGVDVFFVISGYLITNIIISELEQERFSLSRFYERRARRILPALFLTMALCLGPAYVLLLPDPLENFGQSIVATTLFSNNILLYLTSGYWDLASEYKPLLHTWSLAVEEQYYVLFPLLMMALWRFKMLAVEHLLMILCVLSFSFSVLEDDRDLAFYSLHSRGFEILAGALISLNTFQRRLPSNKYINNAMSLCGLVLVVSSITFFNENTPFPGFSALVPVVGTCLIISFVKENTILFRILSHRYLTSIGLISYSAYLFHQPVLSFVRASSKSDLSILAIVFSIATTFFLAKLSFKFVEAPFRNRDVVSTRALLAVISFFGIMLLVVGLWIHSANGFSSRIYEKFEPLERSKNLSARAWEYSDTSFEESSRPNVLVIGNSFARDIVNILVETYDVSRYSLRYSSALTDCSLLKMENRRLFMSADLVLFGSGYEDKTCVNELLARSVDGQEIYFLGDKQFGYNLNWILREAKEQRGYLRNRVTPQFLSNEAALKRIVPPERFVSLTDPLIVGTEILITDEYGRLISDDRRHLTLSGARLLGEQVIRESKIDEFFKQ